MTEDMLPSIADFPNLDQQTRACLNLWGTVMLQGVRAARWGRSDAKRWLESNSEQVGGFRWLCSLFNYDPDTLRRAIVSAPTSPDQSHPEDEASSD